MKRRWLCVAVFVAAVAALGFATGTQESSAADTGSFEGRTLDLALFQGGYGREYFDAVVANFERDYPGVKVNVVASPRIWDVIRPQIVAGNPPDFIYLSEGDQGGLVASLIKDRALADLTDVFEGDALDSDDALSEIILPGVLESRTCSPYGDGRVYLAPYNYTVMGLWYNKTLFDEHGIEPPQTWDEFFALADIAAGLERALFTYQGIYPGYLEEILIPSIYSAGGADALRSFSEFDPDFWNSNAARQVADVFSEIATTPNGLMDGTVALNHTQSQTEFMKGNAMFIVNGSWFEGEMRDAPRETGFEFGFAGVPAFSDGEPVTCFSSIETFMVPSGARNIDVAKEFLRYMYTPESVVLNGELAGGVTAVAGAVDAVKDSISAATYNTYKAVESGMVSVNGRFMVLPQGSRLTPSDEVYNPMTSIMNGDLTTDQWRTQLDRIWEQAADEIAAADAE